jgi:hypothetical protein
MKGKSSVLKSVSSPRLSVSAEVASRSFDDTSKEFVSDVPSVHPYIFFLLFFQSLFMMDGLQRVVKDLPLAMQTLKIFHLGPFMVEGQRKYLWMQLFLSDIR